MAELFDRIEINRAPRWPMLSRLLALSVVVHGMFILAVVYVPTLRSLLYVAGNMAGIKFVSEDYDRTLYNVAVTATWRKLPLDQQVLAGGYYTVYVTPRNVGGTYRLTTTIQVR